MIDGVRLNPASIADGVYSFALRAPRAGGIRLRSRSAVPSLVGMTRHDHRRLGIALRQLILQQSGMLTCIDADAPLLQGGGCHVPEDGFCWTDGELELPTSLFAHLAGGCTLIVHSDRRAVMRYPLRAEVAAAA